jgi:hypothetical protein
MKGNAFNHGAKESDLPHYPGSPFSQVSGKKMLEAGNR